MLKLVWASNHFLLPRVDLRKANQAVRRAMLDKDLCILFEPIDPDKLTIACHSDTAFSNVGEHTQAGTSSLSPRNLCKMGLKPNGYPLHGAVINLELLVAALAAGSQAFCTASGSVEWLSLMLAEILDGDLILRERGDVLKRRPPILVTDCKSLYLVSLSARI